jgi:hydroxyethylthiazole kinase-like uncharacterized protein yjeF
MTPALSPIYRSEDIRRIEAAAFALSPPAPLMERAGLAAAELIRAQLGSRDRVLVLAGPGNNGGDAFVAARHLRQWWVDTTVVFTGTAESLPADAKAACDAWLAAGGTVQAQWPDGFAPDIVVDGLFGIGLRRPLDGRHAELVARTAASRATVIALDVPSGLQADTGQALGTAVRADHTITFIALKPGLLTLDGPDHAGAVHVAALGLDAAATVAPSGFVIDGDSVRIALPNRRRNTHKGDYGDVAIVGGAAGMAGAAWLAGRAALLLGAGRVYVGLADAQAPTLDPLHPELMMRSAADVVNLPRARVMVVGPGLGQSDTAAALLDAAIARDVPLVLDADALNLVALDDDRARRVRERTAGTIATPHPAEAARLLATDTAAVQADRIFSSLQLAEKLNAWTVLKGAGSVCAGPDGTWFVNTTGNPGMAAAGMGDVLSGMTGALVARGASIQEALLAAVHLHGLAGDAVAANHGGLIGVTAGEVATAARLVANRMVYGT